MRVLILGLNYAPEPVGIGPYTAGLAEALAEAGHQVSVVCGKPYYPGWTVLSGYPKWRPSSSKENGVEILRCPLYVPARPSGARRIVHHLSFAFSALGPMLLRARRQRPDLVLTIAPSLASAPVARWAARLAGARSWIHIQDFEVEAAFATRLLREHSAVGRLARLFQRWAMRGFDRYSSISPQMCARLRGLGIANDRVVEFRNWAAIDRVRVIADSSALRDHWQIGDRHVALYSGNIAMKQGIGILVQAARRLAHRDDIRVVICGQGPSRAALETAVTDLHNVELHDLQPAEQLSDLLGLASIHLLPQMEGAADLVLPSKLTNMLASGRPVIATAVPGTGLAEEVEGCGLVTPPGNADALAAAIERLIDEPQLAASLGRAAQVRAEERWSRQVVLGSLIARAEALVRS